MTDHRSTPLYQLFTPIETIGFCSDTSPNKGGKQAEKARSVLTSLSPRQNSFGSSQVYGRAYRQKTTEIGQFKNEPCTIRYAVASSFTALRDKSCESGATGMRDLEDIAWVNCESCNKLMDLSDCNFNTAFCGCYGSCPHGICDECRDDLEKGNKPKTRGGFR